MAKAKRIEDAPSSADAAPGEFGPISYPEYVALPEDVRRRRASRGYQRFLALKGQVQLNLDIDELRGRNRR